MSTTGPNVYVTIGDTDCLTCQYKHADIALDSRLMGVRHEFNGSVDWRSIVGQNTRNPTTGTGFYAEFEIIASNADTNGNMLGLVLSGSESTITSTYVGAVAGTCSYQGGGNIYLNGVAVQTGLASVTTGDRVGIRLYRSAGTLTVQFYKNGSPVGTAITPTDGAYKIACSTYYLATAYRLHVDRDDLKYLSSMPSGTQPWGASARVSDAGGYSPAASSLDSSTASSGNVSVDTYAMVATTTTAAWSSVRGTKSRKSGAAQKIYVEFSQIDDAALCGLVSASAAVSAYPGADATGWGFLFTDYDAYHNGAATAYSGSFTSSDRLGLVWEPSTGELWFLKNGTAIAGDPSAGTGATFSNATGTLVPAIGVNTGGAGTARARMYTHARDQLYRPSYCEAWDGSDLLPELHYKGLLGNDPYIEQGIWFPIPWGGDRSGAPIGAIEVLNNDGEYDALSDYMLRNQRVAIDRVWPNEGTPEAEARAIVNSTEIQEQETLRVVSDSLLSKLEKRIESSPYLIGSPFIIPATNISAAALTYRICHTPFFSITTMRDNGVAVTGYRYVADGTDNGFLRTAAPAGKQVLESPFGFTLATTTATQLTNSEFTSWSGGNPTGWTVVENGGTSNVSQSGNAARMQRGAGAPECSIQQTGTFGNFIKLVITAYTSGYLSVESTGGTYNVGITGTGTYYAPIMGDDPKIAAADTTDLTLDSVTTYDCDSTDEKEAAFRDLLETQGGLTSADYVYTEAEATPDLAHYETERVTIAALCRDILAARCSAMYEDASGLIRFAWINDPTLLGASQGSLREEDLRSQLSVEDDRAPSLTTRFQSANNHAAHNDNEIAGAVSDTDQGLLTSPYSETTVSSTAYDGFYSQAVHAPPMYAMSVNTPTQLQTRLTNAYDTKRKFYRFRVGASAVRRWRIGLPFSLTHSRFGLSAGKTLMLVKVERSAKLPTVRVTAWG